MPEALHFEGFIKDVKYVACLDSKLQTYELEEFDINKAKSYGLIKHSNGELAYSKWVSPKRTRSYPFERLYNTYNRPFRITIIPVIKDEGLDGDLDRVQYTTLSMMNLLNVYIVLAYYETARKNTAYKQLAREKLTGQILDSDLVNSQIQNILSYKQSALHWNVSLMESNFAKTYRTALDSYQKISLKTGVQVHDPKAQMKYLESVENDYLHFKQTSLSGGRGASQREILTSHGFEYLSHGNKATLEINNYLGGVYYLTADEVIVEGNNVVIQESKNCSEGFLPSVSDIKDGLFKLILYSNLDTLLLNSTAVNFSVRLKLTGSKINGELRLPCIDSEIDDFILKNQGLQSLRHKGTLALLNSETKSNPRLSVEIGRNY